MRGRTIVEWTCDLCGKVAQSEDDALPTNWRQQAGTARTEDGVEFREALVFCGFACSNNYQKALQEAGHAYAATLKRELDRHRGQQ